MSMVAKYNRPTNAGEMARLIETMIVAELGLSSGGGYGPVGGELSYDLENDDVAVVVLPNDQAVALKRGVGRIAAGERLDWLDEEEQEIVEAHRAAKRGDETTREPSGAVGEAGVIECEFFYEIENTEVTVHTWFGPADEWDADETRDALEPWGVVRIGDIVQAMKLVTHVTDTGQRYAVDRLSPSRN